MLRPLARDQRSPSRERSAVRAIQAILFREISGEAGFIGAAALGEKALSRPTGRSAACREDGMPPDVSYLKNPAYFLPSLLGPV